MVTTFNKMFGWAVVRVHFSSRGYPTREEVYAACIDRDAAQDVYRKLKLDNPGASFLFHQVV
jgi:hypothetical protein